MSAWKKLGLLPAGGVGLGASVVLTALLCLAMTPLFTKELLPLSGTDAAAVAAAGLSVFLAVRTVAGRRGRQALATAGITAGGYIVLAALVCALGGRGAAFGPWLWRLSAAVAAGGLLGAIMSLRRSGSRRGKRRAR